MDDKSNGEEASQWEVVKININDLGRTKVESTNISTDIKLDLRSFQQYNETRKDQILTLQKKKLP
jgi:hypothetical protein